jgi:hypothetical protein
MHLMAFRDTGYLGDAVTQFHHHGKHQRLHLRSIKLISDGDSFIFNIACFYPCSLDSTGAIGSWGAAMYEPYTDNPSTSGFLVISLEDLQRDIPKYIEKGWQVVSQKGFPAGIC